MNQQIKTLWLEALRSGKYEKGRGKLKDDNDTYCCLGVLTDLYIKEHKNARWVYRGFGSYYLSTDDTKEYEALPEPVCKWAGLPQYTELSGKQIEDVNDQRNPIEYTFNEIADMIEEQL